MAYGDRSGSRDRSSGGRRSFSGGQGNNRSGGFGGRGRSGGYGGQRGGFSSRPREMHKTKCADCGKECEVPFKPTEGRPVYCRECFQKHRDETPSRGPSRRRDDDEDDE